MVKQLLLVMFVSIPFLLSRECACICLLSDAFVFRTFELESKRNLDLVSGFKVLLLVASSCRSLLSFQRFKIFRFSCRDSTCSYWYFAFVPGKGKKNQPEQPESLVLCCTKRVTSRVHYLSQTIGEHLKHVMLAFAC